MARKKIPNLNIHLGFGANLNTLHKNPQVQELIYTNLVLGIKDANNSNKNEAIIVELHSSGNYVQIHRSKWKESLEKAKKYYSDLEKYEICSDIQKLIKSINCYGTGRLHKTPSGTN
jgi:hypothetical protein